MDNAAYILVTHCLSITFVGMNGLDLVAKWTQKLLELILFLGNQADIWHHYEGLFGGLLLQILKHYKL